MYVILLSIPIPYLMNDSALAGFTKKNGRLHGWASLNQVVIIPNRSNKNAAWPQLALHLHEGSIEVFFREQVRQRIICGQDGVESFHRHRTQLTHIRYMELHLDAKPSCFSKGAGDGGPAEIRSNDLVSPLG